MKKYIISNIQVYILFTIFLYFAKEDSEMLIINGFLYYILINIQPFFQYDFDTFIKFTFLYILVVMALFYIMENKSWRCFILVMIWFVSSIFIKNTYLFGLI